MSESTKNQLTEQQTELSEKFQKIIARLFSGIFQAHGRLTYLNVLSQQNADILNQTSVLSGCCVLLQIVAEDLEELLETCLALQGNSRPGVTEESEVAEFLTKSKEPLKTQLDEEVCLTGALCTSQRDDTMSTAGPVISSGTITSDIEYVDGCFDNMSFDMAREIFLNRGFVNGRFRPEAWRNCIIVISEKFKNEVNKNE